MMMSRYTFILVLFFLSGGAGLIYESIWSHYLKLFLGHAAYAQTLVLIIFMGGMAIGAWLISKYSNKIKNMLLFYLVTELLIGVAGILFHTTFMSMTNYSFSIVIPYLQTPLLVTTYKWLIAGSIILPQSILLGATFPLLTSGLIRLYPQRTGTNISILYFVNSLGGAIGILFSGFYLMKTVGLPGTILVAAVMNIAVAAGILLLIRNDAVTYTKINISKVQQINNPLSNNKLVVYLLICSLITGAASFMYEIGWIRMLSLVLGSSTHAFELMLSAFILGLALGSLFIKTIIDKIKSPITLLALVQILMAILAVSTMVLYNELFAVMQFLIRALAKTVEGYNIFSFASHLIALSLMLPVTFCAGMTLPLITNILLSNNHDEANIGRVYAFNTVGAIVGTIVAVNLIMPTLGLKYVLVIGALLDLAIGIMLLNFDFGKESFKSFVIFSSTVAVICILSFFATHLDYHRMASGVFRHGNLFSRSNIVYHKDGKTASVDVVKSNENNMYISTNGKPDASYSFNDQPGFDETTQILLGIIPYSILPQAKHVAIIGYGSGMTASVLLESPNLETLDIIEIEPAIIEGAKYFKKISERLHNDKRVTIHIEDAKAFFSANPNRKYDVIISEPSNPWVSGVSSLFTFEFYALIKNYLTPNGIFAQWLHTYEIYPSLVASVANSMAKEFKSYDAFFTSNVDVTFVASNKTEIPPITDQAFKIPEFRQLLKRIGMHTYDDLACSYIANKKLLAPLYNSYSTNLNSDFFPILDLHAEQARFVNAGDDTLLQLKNSLSPWQTLQDQRYHYDAANINSNNFFANSMLMHDIYLKYKYLVKKENNLNLDFSTLQTLDMLTGADKLCAAAASNNQKYLDAWQQTFLENTFAAISFLKHDQYSAIWGVIKPTCTGFLDNKTTVWIELLDSWIYAKYAKTADLSKLLLTDIAVLPGSQEYLMALNMNLLSNIKVKNYTAALNTWQGNTFRNSSVVLQLLGSYAYAESKKDANMQLIDNPT